jgi:hypothetical protein
VTGAVLVLCPALARVDGYAGARAAPRKRGKVGHRVAAKHRAESVEEELRCHHPRVAHVLVSPPQDSMIRCVQARSPGLAAALMLPACLQVLE